MNQDTNLNSRHILNGHKVDQQKQISALFAGFFHSDGFFGALHFEALLFHVGGWWFLFYASSFGIVPRCKSPFSPGEKIQPKIESPFTGDTTMLIPSYSLHQIVTDEKKRRGKVFFDANSQSHLFTHIFMHPLSWCPCQLNLLFKMQIASYRDEKVWIQTLGFFSTGKFSSMVKIPWLYPYCDANGRDVRNSHVILDMFVVFLRNRTPSEVRAKLHRSW